MLFLYDNIVVFAVAGAVSLMAWLFGGARSDVLLPVMPWVLALMIDLMFCFPQRYASERQFEARARVWQELRGDPVVWICLGFLFVLIIPFFNYGLCPSCDAELIAQGYAAAPPISFLPFCVDRMDHLNTVFWFALVALAVIGVRNCLLARGKRLVLSIIVWNGAALSVLGLMQSASGAPGPFWLTAADGRSVSDFFATFGYANMAGDYFTLLFGVAVALWRDRCERIRRDDDRREQSDPSARTSVMERGWFWRAHFYLLPAALFFFSAINTLSRSAILCVSFLAVVFFAHILVGVLSRMERTRRLVVGVWSVVGFSLLIFFFAITMPEKIRREVKTIGTTEVLDRVTGKAQYHTGVAFALWKEHRLFGCGGWGYRHLCAQELRKLGLGDQPLQYVGGANVHNDYLQFLAEHGLVGFGALVAVACLLVLPIVRQWRLMALGARFLKGRERPPKPLQIFALPRPAFMLLCAVLATCVHAFGDCPLRSCAILSLFYVILAALPGFMPGDAEAEKIPDADAHRELLNPEY